MTLSRPGLHSRCATAAIGTAARGVLGLFVSGTLHAACSTRISDATINERFKRGKGVARFSLDSTHVGKCAIELGDHLSGFAEDTGGPRSMLGGFPLLTVRPFGPDS